MLAQPNPHKLAKWDKMLGVVTQEFYRILSGRRIFNEYKRIVLANEDINRDGARFHNWVIHNYIGFIAMAIRRQADTDLDVRSLAKLITEIKENPENIQRSWYIDLWQAKGNELIPGAADAEFTRLAGSGDYFDAANAEADLDKLKKVSKEITRYADRAVAHSSKQPVPASITFSEIDKCLEDFKSLLQKYILLLTAISNFLEPVPENDWQGIFEAWEKIPKGPHEDYSAN